ncbi:hypothetical protein N7471_004789 [Penicillium samsonianum]|uniref:uncharacterized protein n=1 Tax=Penicillium samsonianum TaxID=1882272 RepID=UPI00254803DA|nr:uncharacterized protein N7471_004789 [Penicillium samsonianum]KAJ6138303.1 hypothetical protein N7471_004789 [Penicillium samsonianum]
MSSPSRWLLSRRFDEAEGLSQEALGQIRVDHPEKNGVRSKRSPVCSLVCSKPGSGSINR